MKCMHCSANVLARGLCSRHYQRDTATRQSRPTRDMTDDERFDYYVTRTDACWLWRGSVTGRYGTLRYDGRNQGAHRIAWMRVNGDIQPGLYVCHRCDNPLCVRPDHLFLGTPLDNSQDMVRKGRAIRPRGEAHHLSKLTDAQIAEIRALAASMSQSKIAKRYGIDQSHVSRLISGQKRGRVSLHHDPRT